MICIIFFKTKIYIGVKRIELNFTFIGNIWLIIVLNLSVSNFNKLFCLEKVIFNLLSKKFILDFPLILFSSFFQNGLKYQYLDF